MQKSQVLLKFPFKKDIPAINELSNAVDWQQAPWCPISISCESFLTLDHGATISPEIVEFQLWHLMEGLDENTRRRCCILGPCFWSLITNPHKKEDLFPLLWFLFCVLFYSVLLFRFLIWMMLTSKVSPSQRIFLKRTFC